MLKLELLTDNPILLRELRRRMRGRVLIIIMCLYVLVVCAIAYFIIHMQTRAAANVQGYTRPTDIGLYLYFSIVPLQAFITMLIAPNISAAIIRSEREKHTFEFLQVTTITPTMYVLGSVFSTVMYVVLVLFCGLPVVMIAYLYGGVSNIVPVVVLLLALCVLLASFGAAVASMYLTQRVQQVVLGLSAVFSMMAVIPVTFSIVGPQYAIVPPYQFMGFSIPMWVVILLIAVGVSGAFVIIARRKMFDPAERTFNYRQFLILYILALILVPYHAIGDYRNLTGALCGTILAGGILAENIFLCHRPQIGHEIWRLRREHPFWQRHSDAVAYMALLLVVTLIAMAAYSALSLSSPGIGPGAQPYQLVYLGLVHTLLYLIARAGLCRILMKRVEQKPRILGVLAVADFIILFLPIFAGAETALRGDNLSALMFVAHISPIFALVGAVEGMFAPWASSALLYIIAGTVTWSVQRRMADRFPGEDQEYRAALQAAV